MLSCLRHQSWFVHKLFEIFHLSRCSCCSVDCKVANSFVFDWRDCSESWTFLCNARCLSTKIRSSCSADSTCSLASPKAIITFILSTAFAFWTWSIPFRASFNRCSSSCLSRRKSSAVDIISFHPIEFTIMSNHSSQSILNHCVINLLFLCLLIVRFVLAFLAKEWSCQQIVLARKATEIIYAANWDVYVFGSWISLPTLPSNSIHSIHVWGHRTS